MVSPNTYGSAVNSYLACGWRAVIPVDINGETGKVPRGFTGESRIDPTPTQVEKLKAGYPEASTGLVLPPNVVGFDVDHYGEKRGAETLEKLEAELGALPKGPMSTARGYGKSGIRFFRVPHGFSTAGLPNIGEDVDLIRHGWRYARVEPSRNPKTGSQYQWYGASGAILATPPRPTDFPMLPDAWLAWLDTRRTTATAKATELGEPEPFDLDAHPWLVELLDADKDSTDDGDGRYRLGSHLAYRAAEKGLTRVQTLYALSLHAPTTAKLIQEQGHEDGIGAQRYLERTVNRAFIKHNHEGQTCEAADCTEKPTIATVKLQPTKATPPKSRLIRKKASEYTIRPVHWCWECRIPVGEITLEVGREGAGKSIFTCWLVAQLTNGTLPGRYFGEKRIVWYVASEDSWEATIAPRLLAAGADMDYIEHIAVAVGEDDETKITVPRDCALIGDEAMTAGAVMVVFDPLLSVIDGEISTNQTRELREALEPLRKHAERARLSVLALMHFNKMQTGDVLTKIAGARGFAEVARAALAIAVDPEAEDYTVVVSQAKNNLGRMNLSNLAYTIEEFEIPTPEGVARPGRLRWISDEYGASAESILNRDAKAKTNKPKARDWLYEYLEAHTKGKEPADRADVLAAAEEAGFSPKTINNTMTKLKEKYAHTEEHGFGAEKQTLWGLKSSNWVKIIRME